jgi:hypothetical protein
MPLTTEIITAQKLTPEQVTAIGDVILNDIAEVKKTYDGKANADAEAILDGAVKAVVTKTGIQREQGQKVADYITFAAEKHVEGKLATATEKANQRQKELDELIKNGAGDAALKSKNEQLSAALDNLQKKEAEFDRVTTAKFEELYSNLKNENLNLKQTTAFNTVKPSFPDTVNRYEADAKWGNFVTKIKNAYDIEFDDQGKPIAISKENKHKIYQLADLVAKDEEIKTLTTGIQRRGTGADVKGNVTIKGVPFAVPENATPAERQKAITDYLLNDYRTTTGEKITRTSPMWAKLFSELNQKLLQGTAA